MAQPPPTIEIVFPSCPSYLALVRANVRWVSERNGFSESEASRICLAVVEAVTNIIRHAYHGEPEHSIVLRLTELSDGVEFQLLDHGESVAPHRVAARERESLEPGGLGVRLMQTTMDHFQYEPRPGGGSRLVLRKLRESTGRGTGEANEAKEG